MLRYSLRSRWFAALVHLGLWALLVFVLVTLGGRAPRFSLATVPAPPSEDPIPTSTIQRLFGARVPFATLQESNLLNPFFTRHFEPPVVPAPTTRRVELTYHGFFQTADSPLTALLNVGGLILPLTPGATAVADLAVAEITFATLTLTNAAGQPTPLPVNVKRPVDVPIK